MHVVAGDRGIDVVAWLGHWRGVRKRSGRACQHQYRPRPTLPHLAGRTSHLLPRFSQDQRVQQTFQERGWLTAWTELDPKSGFRYEIVEEGGSEYIRRRVLRKLLEGERDAVASGQPGKAALTMDNYRFGVVEDDGTVMRLSVMPKRSDGLLVNGTITAASHNGDLLSIEGRLAKNPSWWTSRVDVTRRYDRINGIRVPVEVVSTAHIKIAGAAEMRMTYEYQTINGQVVATAVTSTRTYEPSPFGSELGDGSARVPVVSPIETESPVALSKRYHTARYPPCGSLATPAATAAFTNVNSPSSPRSLNPATTSRSRRTTATRFSGTK
jgi:hypothetical protein